jgi:hypothetical protein
VSQTKTKPDDERVDSQRSGASTGEALALKWRILIAVVVLAILTAIVLKQAF